MSLNLSKVKLIVSDMDGTLLNSKSQVSERFFELYKQLKKNNTHFVAASGRQFYSISNKLESIKNEITIIAENGGFVKHENKTLLVTSLPVNSVQNTIHLIRNIEGAFTVLCGKNHAYIETKNPKFISLFSEYYNNYLIVDDLTKVKDDKFLKIAIYHFKNAETYIYPRIKHLENEMLVKISGKNWLDLSNFDANKGFALQLLQEKLKISKEETVVFGDYNNDIEMLQLGHFSFAMENAHVNVKKIARFQTKSNDAGGVEYILEQILKDKIKYPLK